MGSRFSTRDSETKRGREVGASEHTEPCVIFSETKRVPSLAELLARTGSNSADVSQKGVDAWPAKLLARSWPEVGQGCAQSWSTPGRTWPQQWAKHGHSRATLDLNQAACERHFSGAMSKANADDRRRRRWRHRHLHQGSPATDDRRPVTTTADRRPTTFDRGSSEVGPTLAPNSDEQWPHRPSPLAPTPRILLHTRTTPHRDTPLNRCMRHRTA